MSIITKMPEELLKHTLSFVDKCYIPMTFEFCNLHYSISKPNGIYKIIYHYPERGEDGIWEQKQREPFYLSTNDEVYNFLYQQIQNYVHENYEDDEDDEDQLRIEFGKYHRKYICYTHEVGHTYEDRMKQLNNIQRHLSTSINLIGKFFILK